MTPRLFSILLFLSSSFLQPISAEPEDFFFLATCPFNRECLCRNTPGSFANKLTNEEATCNTNDQSLPIFSSVDSNNSSSTIVDKFMITKSLDIRSDVAKLPADYFARFESIESLQLHHTGSEIQNWNERAFDGGVRIGELRIFYLPGVLPPGAALRRLGARSLTSLSITRDRSIRLDEDGLFRGLDRLRALSINNADLNRRPLNVSANVFAGLESRLEELALENVVLSETPGAIRNLKGLKKLILNNNKLTSIPRGFFLNFPLLEHLSLNGNNLSKAIDDGLLDSLPRSLRNLELRRLGLESIPRRLFKDLSNLTELDLSENRISVIRKADLRDLKNLEVLKLGGNRLTAIEDGALLGLKLRKLDLHGSNLSRFDLTILDGMQPKSEIDLSGSGGLKRIEMSNISRTPFGLRLDLSSTGLETIDTNLSHLFDQTLFRPLFLALTGDHELKCDQLASWMAPYYVCQRNDSLIKADVDVLCRSDADGSQRQQTFGRFMESRFPTANCSQTRIYQNAVVDEVSGASARVIASFWIGLLILAVTVLYH